VDDCCGIRFSYLFTSVFPLMEKGALPDLLGLLCHVDQQLENRLSLKPHLDAVDNDI
jgi:hypothetical protein